MRDGGEAAAAAEAEVAHQRIEEAASRAALAAVAAADTNGDGVVDDAEFFKEGALNEEERLAATWGVWGTTLYSTDLRPKAAGPPFVLKITKPPAVPEEYKRVIASSEF